MNDSTPKCALFQGIRLLPFLKPTLGSNIVYFNHQTDFDFIWIRRKFVLLSIRYFQVPSDTLGHRS